jgi:hypothetical protein
MMVVISRLYDSPAAAHFAVNELMANGLPEDDISVISPKGTEHPMVNAPVVGETGDRIDRDGDGKDDRTRATEQGAGIGALFGGAAAGLGVLAIPGIGAVAAVGWLAAIVAGAVAGGATGGIIGALSKAGIDPNKAEIYAEAVRRGGTLVTIRSKEEDLALYQDILGKAALDVDALGDAYKAEGWQGFDPAGMPIQLRGTEPFEHP